MEHSFDVEVAKDVGVNAAIIYKNIQFWCLKNKANEKHFHDGYYWTYNTKKAFSELMPYFTARQVEYALNTLIKNNYIITGNYNSSAYDRTLWYADIRVENTDKTDKNKNDDTENSQATTNTQNCEIKTREFVNENTQIVEPIPYNKLHIKNTDGKAFSSEAADTAKTITEYSVHDKEEVSVKPKPKFKMSAPEQMFESEYQFGNTKPRKSNLHEKCIAYVYEWTNDDNTRKLLIQYLGLCFEMGSIRGINQWKGMLDNTLVKCQQKSEPHTYDELIQLAIDHGWKTFYEWKEYGGKTKQYKSSISDADYRSNRRVTAADKSGRAF